MAYDLVYSKSFPSIKIGKCLTVPKDKEDDIIETISLIRRYHYCLTYGTYADKKHQIGIGEYRKNPSKLGVPARLISSKLDELIQSYENKSVDMDAILDFHVRFEKIHPFEDCNGRVGEIGT